MKNRVIIICALVAAFILAGCQKEKEVIPVETTHSVTFTAEKMVDTRTAIDSEGNGVVSYKWIEGDGARMHVYEFSADGDTVIGTVTNMALSNNDRTATFSVSFAGEAPTDEVSYKAVYGGVVSKACNPRIPDEQSPLPDSFDPNADALVSEAIINSDGQETNPSFVFNMNRVVSVNKMTLKGLTEGEILSSVIFESDKHHTGYYSVSSGSLTQTGKKITLTFTDNNTIPASGEFPVYFTTAPVENATFSVTVVTNRKRYRKTSTKQISFAVGQVRRFGVDMTGYEQPDGRVFTLVTDPSNLAIGSEVVIAANGNKNIAMSTTQNDNNRDVTAATKSSGYTTITTTELVQIFTLVAGTQQNTYAFSFDDGGTTKYLYAASSSKNYLRSQTSLDDNASWTIDISSSNDATVTAQGTNTRNILRYNSNDKIFSCYASGQQSVFIYQAAARLDPEMSWSSDSVAASITGDGVVFTAPTLDLGYASSNLVSYTSSNTSVATVDSDGTVNVVGPGETTISASFAGDTYYRPAIVSYTITVTAPTPTTGWIEVTDLSSVDAGQYVITWDNTYYLPTTAASSNPAVGTGITVENRALTNTVTSDMVWTFTGNNTDGFTVSSDGNYLNSSNKAQGISVSNSSSTTWKVSLNTDYGILMKGSDVGSRYLAVYNSGSWRYYTLGGDYSGTLRLYKLVDNTNWNLSSIAVTNAPTKTTYVVGELFDPTGMVVTGHFVDANDATNTKDEAVTGYTISPDGALATTDTQVTITYQGKSTTQDITVNAAPAGNDGSLEHPYTASEARALALNGNTDSYYISGIVTKIQNQYSASYGTANFWIDENGTSQTVFQGYKIKYFGNVNWVEGNAEIAVNDEVIIYGTLALYTNNNNTVPETSSGYLVSLNGKTKGLSLTTPTVTTNDSAKQITVAWTAATGTESAISYVVSCGTQSYNASAAGSHTFTMADYGTYSVSVVASANDAISATASTTATISDPSSSAPDPVTINVYSNQANITGSGVGQTATWTSGDITVTAVKTSSTATAFRNSDSDHTRFYSGWSLTVTSASNTIASVEFNCSTNAYATALGNLTFSEGTASTFDSKVIVSGVDASSTSATMAAQVRISSITVTYK